MSEHLTFTVPTECDNMSARKFLKEKCCLSSRMIARLKREKDGILMNGKILRTIDRVTAGAVVLVTLPNEEITVEPTEGCPDVLFEDEHFLVVNKPPAMPVHPVKQHQTDTLANIVSYYCLKNDGGFVFRAINRLDKDTSGAVLIAKNRYSAFAVKDKTRKIYYAICEGKICEPGTVDKAIALTDCSKIVRTVKDGGKPAVTHYRPLCYSNGCTMLELWLETGRTHQIRCHMSYLGHPLAGDDLYGGGLEKIQRQALHCAELTFFHPVRKEYITVTAPIPNDMKLVIGSQKIFKTKPH